MDNINAPVNAKKCYILGSNIENIVKYSKLLDDHNIHYCKPSRISKENSQFKEANNLNVTYLINTNEDTIKNLLTKETMDFDIRVLNEN